MHQAELIVSHTETAQALKDPTFKIRTITPEMKHTLDALEKEYTEPVCHMIIT